MDAAGQEWKLIVKSALKINSNHSDTAYGISCQLSMELFHYGSEVGTWLLE